MQVDTTMKKELIIVSEIRKAEYRKGEPTDVGPYDVYEDAAWFIGNKKYVPCNHTQCEYFKEGTVELLCSYCCESIETNFYTEKKI